MGRPPIFDSPEQMQERIEEYFLNCPDYRTVTLKDGTSVKIPTITITGLVLFLGFADRASFYDYEKKPEFSHTIKRARTFVEREYEIALQGGNPTGPIFALKNFGWKDKTETEGSLIFKQMPTIKTNDGKEITFDCGEDVPL